MYIQVIALASTPAILCGCSGYSLPRPSPQHEYSVYRLEDLDHPLIQFIWLEIPEPLETGEVDVGLFLARTNPPEPLIPNPTELKCTLKSKDAAADLVPEQVAFQFSDDGSFTGIYTYRACPECVECYMNWDYMLELSGVLHEEKALLDIAVRHIGLNVQGSYLSVELERLDETDQQPQIECKGDGTCAGIVYVNRDG